MTRLRQTQQTARLVGAGVVSWGARTSEPQLRHTGGGAGLLFCEPQCDSRFTQLSFTVQYTACTVFLSISKGNIKNNTSFTPLKSEIDALHLLFLTTTVEIKLLFYFETETQMPKKRNSQPFIDFLIFIPVCLSFRYLTFLILLSIS